MTSNEVRQRFFDYFKGKGHVIVPSASLVPENDPTTLFTGSGMQPMVPYLLGEKHPLGTRIADSQKSFRSGDIEDVGDNRHTTFFEMLGNWSLGDFFKKEQIPWMFEFLIDEIGIDPQRFYVSTFIGDTKNNIPKDTEAVEIWKELFAKKGIDAKVIEIGSEENGGKVGMQGGRIFYYDVKKNWWSRAGVPEKMPANEPGGPDTEMFYEFIDVPHDKKYGEHCHPNCDCGRFLEIGNNVFMEYKKNPDGTFSKLPQKNVDFGGGFERIVAALVNTPDVFRIDIFTSVIATLEKLSGKSYADEKYTKSFRVVADHVRASIFLIGDGVNPSNSDQGYFVRRLLRRAVRHWDLLGIKESGLTGLVPTILDFYKDAYPDTFARKAMIMDEVSREEEKFRKTVADGIKEFHKLVSGSKPFDGAIAFTLFTSYGFPYELAVEVAQYEKITIASDTKAVFDAEMKKHQDLSRAGAEQKFKGGLGDTSEMSLKYHTATHLLHQALRQVLGSHVSQKGSNITTERLRFDFTHTGKMTDDEKKKVEDIVNSNIQKKLTVHRIELPKAEAEKTGALHFFGDKYGDVVSVYYIGDSIDAAVSKEFCGGPHVENTGTLGTFKIQKEEAVSAGTRRIKAVLS